MDSKLRAILVSVDYSDLLAITLPHNRHHFHEVFVVTSTADAKTVEPITSRNGATLVVTDRFYDDGADFNKWLALEFGLDMMGRRGWICLMDADVLWPKVVDLDRYLRKGFLFGPRRRIADPIPDPIPLEEDRWRKYPLHRQEREVAGYSQIFHADDPVLGPPPWHETDWRHAGGADSFFQAKWPAERKVRPPFEVLHLGPPGVNWYGRASSRLDGTEPPEAQAKKEKIREIWRQRAEARARGQSHRQFDPEKLGGR